MVTSSLPLTGRVIWYVRPSFGIHLGRGLQQDEARDILSEDRQRGETGVIEVPLETQVVVGREERQQSRIAARAGEADDVAAQADREL